MICSILLISFLFLFLHSKNFSNSEIIMFLGIVVVASFRILPAIARLTNSISLLRFYKFSVDIIFKELSQNNNIKFHQKFAELFFPFFLSATLYLNMR